MEGKKSFVLYADLIHMVDKLPREIKGDLFQLILDYVNDKDPQTDDLILQIAFDPIKRQLKRDLEKWRGVKIIKSQNGKLGGRPPKNKKLNKADAFSQKLTEAKKAVTVNVSDTVNVTDNVIVSETKEVAPELIFNYMIDGKEILSVEETFKEKFSVIDYDLKIKHGELKFKKWMGEFSELHKQKSWKDLQDFRHHIASFIKIQSEKENGSTKKLNTGQSKDGSVGAFGRH
jgi:hypothetical protein